MDKKQYLYCYIMTHDTGFAPNPEHEVLTLATCKPTIRRCAEPGTWISGWAGVKVYTTVDRKKYFDGNTQKLIYLARITKKISIAEYWNQNTEKQPKLIDGKYDQGDNIYELLDNGLWQQHENGGGHDKNNEAHDLSGKKVLICDEFYYFGVENALAIDIKELDSNFVVPRCKKLLLESEIAQSIIQQVKNNHDKCKKCKCR